MEPSSGASTWALGSQRWSKYMGILAKNAVIIKITIENFNSNMLDRMNDILFNQKIIVISRGNEAITVYIIR